MWSAVSTARHTADAATISGVVFDEAALLSAWQPLVIAVDQRGPQFYSRATGDLTVDSGNARQRCALWQSWQV